MHKVRKTATAMRPVSKRRATENCDVDVAEVLKHGVSQSELMTFVACKCKKRLGLGGWRPLKNRDALDFGDVGHKLMQQIDTRLKIELKTGAKSKFADVQDVVLFNVQEFMGERAKQFKRTAEAEQHELFHAMFEALLVEYYRFYHTSKQMLSWDVVGLERPLPMLPFGETFLQGTVDMVFEKPTGRCLLDHKFKGQINEGMLMQTLETDFQLFFYAYAMLLETGKLPYEAIYDVIRRPGIKLNQGENLKAYTKRIVYHIQKEPEHYFKRFTVQFLPSDIEVFKRDLQVLVAEYVAWLRAGRPYRLYGNPCENKYGLCEFYSLCHHDSQALYVKGEAGGYRPMPKQTKRGVK